MFRSPDTVNNPKCRFSLFRTALNMLLTCHRVISPASVGADVPTRVEASKQTASYDRFSPPSPGLQECLGSLSDARGDGPLSCRICAVFEGTVAPAVGVMGNSDQATVYYRG